MGSGAIAKFLTGRVGIVADLPGEVHREKVVILGVRGECLLLRIGTDIMEELMSKQIDEIFTLKGAVTHIRAGKCKDTPPLGNGGVFALNLRCLFLFRWGDLDNWVASRVSKGLVDFKEVK